MHSHGSLPPKSLQWNMVQEFLRNAPSILNYNVHADATRSLVRIQSSDYIICRTSHSMLSMDDVMVWLAHTVTWSTRSLVRIPDGACFHECKKLWSVDNPIADHVVTTSVKNVCYCWFIKIFVVFKYFHFRLKTGGENIPTVKIFAT